MAGQPRSLATGERLTLALVLGGFAALLFYQGWLWRGDQLIYDTQLQLLSRPASDDIVIIAIDQHSLDTFGRWPWRRDIHATLLDRLAAEQPAAVAFDIIFAEPDPAYPEGDRMLAAAVERNGRVIMPVLMEQHRQGALPTETLPLPLLAKSVAAMGHVHVELDPDGIARRLFLFEGLGSSYWPHLTLAVLQVAGMELPATQPDAGDGQGTPAVWHRAQPVLIPYAGPPGHFKRISFEQVINGNFVPGTFTGRLVLIGVTASGLGDALPTPVSGYSHSMPGVEINANMLDAHVQAVQIRQLDRHVAAAITILLAMLPVFVYPYLEPRSNLLFAGSMIAGTLALAAGLLFFVHLWWPPLAALVAIVLSYPLWSWRRLERTMRYLNQELDELHERRAELAIRQEPDVPTALAFLSRVMPIRGWALLGQRGEITRQHGEVPAFNYLPVTQATWDARNRRWWSPLPAASGYGSLVVFWGGDAAPGTAEQQLLDEMSTRLQSPVDPMEHSSDLLQARISQVQAATHQLQDLRRFVEDALSFMSDGVVVADAFGGILIANARAGWYLADDDNARLSGKSLLLYLQDVQLQEGTHWEALIRRVLVEGVHVQGSARMHNGRDLLVQIAPLRVHGSGTDALVMNFSDISNLKASERKRSELLNFLSHDLRSPLVSVLALIELVYSKQPPTEISQLLQRMQGNTEKTLDLAEQFLQLARAESSDEYPFSELDLVSVIWNAIEQVWAQARASNIKLVHEFEVEDAWILGEGNLLERALINLLTNAIKYSPANTTVRVTLAREEDRFVCCVVDEGYGIPETALPTLFDRFSRVAGEMHGEVSGAGLGLAFVEAVITRHGGRVDVQSTPGEGSSFCITLYASLQPSAQ